MSRLILVLGLAALSVVLLGMTCQQFLNYRAQWIAAPPIDDQIVGPAATPESLESIAQDLGFGSFAELEAAIDAQCPAPSINLNQLRLMVDGQSSAGTSCEAILDADGGRTSAPAAPETPEHDTSFDPILPTPTEVAP